MISSSLVDYLLDFVVSTWLVDFISLIDMEWILILILFKSQKKEALESLLNVMFILRQFSLHFPSPLILFMLTYSRNLSSPSSKLTAHCCRKSS